ncbi:MAG: hypothetical protein HQM16_13835 [Deltaproteobacteria bacterium]|nr:hypothetical protein [Deltaproteobacteria bacterium]
MKKKNKQKSKDFDKDFDEGRAIIDFSSSLRTEGLSQVIKLPPLTIPAWLNAEIEKIAQLQANSKSSVIRQLLVEALSLRGQRVHA